MYQLSKFVHALFISIGIMCLLSAYILYGAMESRLPGDISKDLGIVVLSITLIHLLWRYTGGEPIESHLKELKSLASFNALASEIGLSQIRARATDVSSADWLALISSSRSKIDLSSHTMSQFLDEPHLWDALVERLNSGVKVRVLLNAPVNPSLDGSGWSPPGYLESRRRVMQNAWETFQEARARLSAPAQANLTIGRLTEETLFVSVRRFDDHMYIAQYLYMDNMRNNPVFLIKGARTHLFTRYLAEFEGLFARAELSPAPESTLNHSSEASEPFEPSPAPETTLNHLSEPSDRSSPTLGVVE